MTSTLSRFRMPVAGSINGRSSSITNVFVSTIIPVIPPTEEEVAEALSILGLTPVDLRCAYCGDVSTEWDHLRPLIVGQRPTGYISEIRNLVPACGKCNQSKGNKDWKHWIVSKAPRSPAFRGVSDIDAKIQRLNAYENWGHVIRIDFAATVEQEAWEKHWANWNAVLGAMRTAQEYADTLRREIALRHENGTAIRMTSASVPGLHGP